MLDSQKEQSYLSMPQEQAQIHVLRDGYGPDELPVSIKIHTDLTDDDLMVSKVMRYPSERLGEILRHCKGGIWHRVSNLMFKGMKPHEARLFILENGFHPKAIPQDIKEYANVSDKEMLKAEQLVHKENLSGKDFWKHFNLAYLIKGMSKEESISFLKSNNFEASEIPSYVRRYLQIG